MSVTIIGGGMTGTILALALSHFTQGRLGIDLVEAHAPESCIHPGFDARAIALAQGTCRELRAIGVWPALVSYATAIRRVEVSERCHLSKVLIGAPDYQLPALGYVIELQEIGIRLFSLLRRAPGVRLHCPAVLKHIRREKAGNLVFLNNGYQLSSRLVVAADGSHSALAVQCGIRRLQREYRQIAIIANVSTVLPHRGNAFERFTPHGPLALLPISGGRSSLIWCLAAARYQEIVGWNGSQFCQKLQQEFGWKLGRIIGSSERHCYPLWLRTAERHVAHRLALVGNAAQTLHPIAGQGFNLGLRDVMTLAETLSQAVSQDEDIGDYSVLRRYQERRKPDQANTINITNGLINLFANRSFPLVIGRNLGLLAMAHFPLLRHALMRKILGWVAR